MDSITPMRTRTAFLVRLDETERSTLERLARRWGVSLAAAMRRLIREAGKRAGRSKTDA